jgi:hypothetical protein
MALSKKARDFWTIRDVQESACGDAQSKMRIARQDRV